MFHNILGTVISFVTATGYPGIFILMFLNSAAIPLPSEALLPFLGFLVATSKYNWWTMLSIASFGEFFGCLFLYAIGYYGGRPLVEKYGKWILINPDDLQRSDKFFAKHGSEAVFFGRLIPLLRTFIAFPAGIAKSNFKKFLIYNLLTAIIWAAAFLYAGVKLGQDWSKVDPVFQRFNLVIEIVVILAIIYYVYKHLSRIRKPKSGQVDG